MNKRKISHKVFVKYIEKLGSEIKDYCRENRLEIDFVVPILRGGAVPAVYLAYQLEIDKFAPMQAKTIIKNDEKYIDFMLNCLRSLDLDKKKPINLLLVDNGYFTGATMAVALSEIKIVLPKANILFAAVVKHSGVNMPYTIQKSFFGGEYDFTKGTPLFPWDIYEQTDLNER